MELVDNYFMINKINSLFDIGMWNFDYKNNSLNGILYLINLMFLIYSVNNLLGIIEFLYGNVVDFEV